MVFYPGLECFEIENIGSLKYLYQKGCELYKDGIKLKKREEACKFWNEVISDSQYINDILFESVMGAIFLGGFPISNDNWHDTCYEKCLSLSKQVDPIFQLEYKKFIEKINTLETSNEPNKLNKLSNDKKYKKFLEILEIINNQKEKKKSQIFSRLLYSPFESNKHRYKDSSSYPPTFVEYIEQCIANTVDLND